MTLWAVQVVAASNNFSTVFPTESRDGAVESAGRINDWVAHMRREHPAHAPNIAADVVEWPLSRDEHALGLAEVEALKAEDEEGI